MVESLSSPRSRVHGPWGSFEVQKPLSRSTGYILTIVQWVIGRSREELAAWHHRAGRNDLLQRHARKRGNRFLAAGLEARSAANRTHGAPRRASGQLHREQGAMLSSLTTLPKSCASHVCHRPSPRDSVCWAVGIRSGPRVLARLSRAAMGWP